MKRLWGYVLATCILTGVGLSTACAHNDESFFIKDALAPPDDCIFKPDPQSPFIATGEYDLGLAATYSPVFLVGNQLIQQADKTTVRAESNRIVLQGAIVRLAFTDGTVLSEFSSLSSNTIDPQPGNDATYGIAALTIIDQPTADTLRGMLPNRAASRTVVAYIKAYGRSLGHQDLESQEFQFPIRVCNGCLVVFPPESNDATKPQPNCLVPKTGGGTATDTGAAKKVCGTGGDQLIDCRDCGGVGACDPARP